MKESNTPIQRSNPENVPLEKLEGKRLLSIEEAEALHKGNGLPELDPELFMWCNKPQKFFPNRFGISTHIYTYATTRPEGHYVLGYIVSHGVN